MATVIVLGMHRSGTSAVAGVLHHLGVWMGASLLQPDHSNPLGYWEDLDCIVRNVQILKLAGGSWWNPPEQGAIVETGLLLRSPLMHLAAKRDGHPVWGFKDPRTCLTLPAWLMALRGADLRLVRVQRNPDAVVASLVRRHAKDTEWWLRRRTENEWHALVCEYQQRLDGYGLPYFEVEYERLVAEPGAEVGRLAELVGLPVTPEAVAHVRMT